MKALWDSLVRTYVPWIVGVVIGWLVSLGVELDPEVETALTVVLMGAAGGLYYLAVRLFETYVSPKFGWLLGLAKAPSYVRPAPRVARYPGSPEGAGAVQRAIEKAARADEGGDA